MVKDDNGKKHECGTTLPKGSPECKNRREHIHPLKHGQCSAGWHEGTQARDFKGNHVPTCKEWKYCPCECHEVYDELFSMSGRPRVAVDNSEYEPPKLYWMPSPEDRAAMHAASSNGHGDTEPVIIESPLPEAVPVTLRRVFAPTPTGRAGRGQLETWVKEACDEWVVEKYEHICSPAWIAEWIIKNKGVATQSQGAVNAVFERWIKLGFAVIEKKPTRFIKYTEAGIKSGIDALKIKAKMDGKRQEAAAGRRIGRS